jgi:hypothetical protein
LTIYWVTEPHGAEAEIWTAHRKDPGSLFTDKRLVGYGSHVTVSSDGLTMFLIARKGDGRPGYSIHVATRRSIDESFGRSQEVPELRSIPKPYNLFLSQDGLTLLFKEGDDDAFRLWMATRRSPQSRWDAPRALPISSRVKFDGIVLCPYLTKDGLTLFCTVQNSAGPRFVVMSRQMISEPFANPVFPAPGDISEFNGWTPRYVEATNELFFCSQRLSPDRDMNLWVVRNFSAILPVVVHGAIAMDRPTGSAATSVPNLPRQGSPALSIANNAGDSRARTSVYHVIDIAIDKDGAGTISTESLSGY